MIEDIETKNENLVNDLLVGTVNPTPRLQARSRIQSVSASEVLFLFSCEQLTENEQKLFKIFERAKKVENSDEIVVTKAKKMGRELFAELDPDARKQKLDSIVRTCEILSFTTHYHLNKGHLGCLFAMCQQIFGLFSSSVHPGANNHSCRNAPIC